MYDDVIVTRTLSFTLKKPSSLDQQVSASKKCMDIISEIIKNN